MALTASQDVGPAASPADFVAGLRNEHSALSAFIRSLQAEQGALVQGDADLLAQLTADKANQIDLLTGLGEQRKRHLASQSLTASAEGMVNWLKRNPGFSRAAHEIWRELLAKAETARQINQDNGILIETRLRQNRLKLAVLQTAAGSEGVYQSDGQLRPLRSARALSQV